MEYIYAALMLHRMNKEVSEDNIVKMVKAIGVEPDLIKIKALVSALKEVNIDEVIKSATSFIPVAASVAPQPTIELAKAKEEKKKEEKKEERAEEALEGLSSLFG
ncbi:MAG: 50S ribosomal protein P1 [Nitrososphaerales archaeon]